MFAIHPEQEEKYQAYIKDLDPYKTCYVRC